MSTWRELYQENKSLIRKVKCTRAASVVMLVLCFVVAFLNAYLVATGDTIKIIWVIIHVPLCALNGWNWHRSNELLRDLYAEQARVEFYAKCWGWDR